MKRCYVLVFLVFLSAIYIRNIYTQRYFNNLALKSFNSRHPIKSVFFYANVIKAYTPFSFYVKPAIDRLFYIYEKEMYKKEYKKALYVLEMIKSSILSTRSFYQPYSNTLAKVKLMIRSTKSEMIGNHNLNKPIPNINSFKAYQPNTFLVFLLEGFFFLWIYFSIKAFNNFGRSTFEDGKFLLYCMLSLTSWILWLNFLYLA